MCSRFVDKFPKRATHKTIYSEHTAIALLGGKVIAYGYNHFAGNRSIHAEQAVIEKLKRQCFKGSQI